MNQLPKWLSLTVIVVLCLLGLAIVSPSYTSVSVEHNGSSIKIQKAGFGPQGIHLEMDDLKVRSIAR